MKREDLKPETLYRLTKDVANPFGDKRKTRGTVAVRPTIPAGTFFRPETWREVFADVAISSGAVVPSQDVIEKKIAAQPGAVAVLAGGDINEGRVWIVPTHAEQADAKAVAKRKALSVALLSHLEEVQETFAFWIMENGISDATIRSALIKAVENGDFPAEVAKEILRKEANPTDATAPSPPPMPSPSPDYMPQITPEH